MVHWGSAKSTFRTGGLLLIIEAIVGHLYLIRGITGTLPRRPHPHVPHSTVDEGLPSGKLIWKLIWITRRSEFWKCARMRAQPPALASSLAELAAEPFMAPATSVQNHQQTIRFQGQVTVVTGAGRGDPRRRNAPTQNERLPVILPDILWRLVMMGKRAPWLIERPGGRKTQSLLEKTAQVVSQLGRVLRIPKLS
jgi:hypothetical protein